ncbi:MAG: hypothetical protein CM15mP18_1370 [Methanobacteriota archaeon]|nr:MAG: hypothetical protein CM15mP18_1370 [Euryarchaeota archaeon]
MVDVRRNQVGWIFRDFHLIDGLSAIDNVAFALEVAGVSSQRETEQRAIEALERVGLGDRMQFVPEQLSGGQQQRVAIARAIAGERRFLLADEPTGNLDIASAAEVLDLFKSLCGTKRSPCPSSWSRTIDLASKADRMLLLRDGQTVGPRHQERRGLDEGGEEE